MSNQTNGHGSNVENGNMTLVDYFSEVYRPANPNELSPSALRTIHSAIKHLNLYVGCSVLVDEVSEELLDSYAQSPDVPLAKSTVVVYKNYARCVAQHAIANSGGPIKPSEYESMTLEAYCRKVFILDNPSRPTTNTATNTMVNTLGAIDKFYLFADREVRIDEVTAELLGDFSKWCNDNYVGTAPSRFRGAIRRLVQHADPEAFSRTVPMRWPETYSGDRSDNSIAAVFLGRFEPEKLLGRTVTTKRHYQMTFGKFQEFLGCEPMLADLTDNAVSRFLSHLIADGLGPRSVNNSRDYLLAFWRWCARKRLVEEWPDVVSVPETPVIPKSWSVEQLSQLYEACRLEQSEIAGVPAHLWWMAIHLVWWDTGERTGATLAIEWENLDLETGMLVVPAHVRKGRKAMTYTLKPKTLDVLRKVLDFQRAGEKCIFAFPYDVGTFYHRYKKILERAGLPTGRRNGPQKMRRSFASHLEAAGGNATEALEHDSSSVTKNSYIDPRIARKEPPNVLLFDIDAGSGKDGAA